MEESLSTRPVVGRLIALDLRPTRPLTFVGPAWVALCGAIGSGGVLWRSQSILILALCILLCDALVGAWRSLWLHADWRVALPRNLANAQIWMRLSDNVPSGFIARLSRDVSRRVAFARNVIWPLVDSEIIGMLIAGILAICIAAMLNQITLALVAIAMFLALVEGEVNAERRMDLRSLIEVMLPWLIAQSAFGYFTWLSLIFVVLFTVVYRALLGLVVAQQERWLVWNNIPQILIVFLLIATNTPIGAAVVALGLFAQMLWQEHYRVNRDGRAYVQHAQSYVLVGMLVVGLSLWF
jgi:hypothetical protein